jgi:hypothetical protein
METSALTKTRADLFKVIIALNLLDIRHDDGVLRLAASSVAR